MEIDATVVRADARVESKAEELSRLARLYAPVFYQDSDNRDYHADYVVAVDYDGDFVGNNNWDNLEALGVDRKGVIYYAGIETETHWFLYYLAFHPRDWDISCQPIPLGPDLCHENDMEGAMVMVEKDQAGSTRFLLMATEAHNNLDIFTNDSGISALGSSHFHDTAVTFEDSTHPELYIESKGHGICALYYTSTLYCRHDLSSMPPVFGGDDGLVYRVADVGEEPESGNDRDVGYELRLLDDDLWSRREDVCNEACLFDGLGDYEGISLGMSFNGDDHGTDKANPPWGWDDPSDGDVYRGDFFFRPALAVTTWLTLPRPVSQVYLYNPYLP